MKQHIDNTQLREVDINKLFELIYDEVQESNDEEMEFYKEFYHDVINIGLMLEILNEGSIKSINLYSDSDCEWFLDMNRHDEKVFQAKELVDCLWEAVKVVINE